MVPASWSCVSQGSSLYNLTTAASLNLSIDTLKGCPCCGQAVALCPVGVLPLLLRIHSIASNLGDAKVVTPERQYPRNCFQFINNDERRRTTNQRNVNPVNPENTLWWRSPSSSPTCLLTSGIEFGEGFIACSYNMFIAFRPLDMGVVAQILQINARWPVIKQQRRFTPQLSLVPPLVGSAHDYFMDS